ncbi:hypothetical protein DFH07DRAFT_409228 [Mycena maculata]|uniref:Uncharacterized protein n=1 Tax=Mycena maculata TaxID=230809 RepID=A0AAD7NIY6_9AGAR|nr:hypothetical protein DFH07DRAFT_409228 [Mycena maculata]
MPNPVVPRSSYAPHSEFPWATGPANTTSNLRNTSTQYYIQAFRRLVSCQAQKLTAPAATQIGYVLASSSPRQPESAIPNTGRHVSQIVDAQAPAFLPKDPPFVDCRNHSSVQSILKLSNALRRADNPRDTVFRRSRDWRLFAAGGILRSSSSPRVLHAPPTEQSPSAVPLDLISPRSPHVPVGLGRRNKFVRGKNPSPHPRCPCPLRAPVLAWSAPRPLTLAQTSDAARSSETPSPTPNAITRRRLVENPPRAPVSVVLGIRIRWAGTYCSWINGCLSRRRCSVTRLWTSDAARSNNSPSNAITLVDLSRTHLGSLVHCLS